MSLLNVLIPKVLREFDLCNNDPSAKFYSYHPFKGDEQILAVILPSLSSYHSVIVLSTFFKYVDRTITLW